MILGRAVRIRLGVELGASDFRVLGVLAMAMATFEGVSRAVTLRSLENAMFGTGFLLVTLWPFLVGGIAALVAARDEEAAMPDSAYAAGVPRSEVHLVQATTALVAAFTLAGTATVIGATVALAIVRGFDGAPGSGPFVGMLLAGPLWAVIGTAVGTAARTRAKAVAGLASLVLALLLVQRLATVIGALRWVHLVTPVGLTEVLWDGYGSVALPLSAPALLVAGAGVGMLLVPVGLMRWIDGRRSHIRTPRRLPRPLTALGAAMLLLAFGYAAPTAVAAAIPWRFSPTWVADQTARRTPDYVVEDFVAALRRGDTGVASSLTASGDLPSTLGLLAVAWDPLPDVDAEVERSAPVAGTVVVTWHRAEGRHSLRACAARFVEGWKITRFTSRPYCPR